MLLNCSSITNKVMIYKAKEQQGWFFILIDDKNEQNYDKLIFDKKQVVLINEKDINGKEIILLEDKKDVSNRAIYISSGKFHEPDKNILVEYVQFYFPSKAEKNNSSDDRKVRIDKIGESKELIEKLIYEYPTVHREADKDHNLQKEEEITKEIEEMLKEDDK